MKFVLPKKLIHIASAKNKVLDRVIGLEMGSDDYIAKPFLPRELVLKVNKLLELKYG